MPDFLNDLQDAPTLRGFIYAVTLVIAVIFLLIVHRQYQTNYPEGGPLSRVLCVVRGLFRRWLPALLALGLATAYYQYTAQQHAHQAALAEAVTAGRLNADSSLIAEAANTAVPPFGDVTGKFIFALGLFFGGLAAVWFVKRFVVPVLPRWATTPLAGYKEAFLTLPPAEQLRTFNLVWLSLLGYYALCVLAACLVN